MFHQFLHAISVFLTVLRYWVKATFTETAIKTKFVDRFFLNFFCTLIDQCTIKSPNFLSIENFWSRLTWAQKWVNIEAMSYIRLSFCFGTCLEFSTTSNCHAASENLPHLVALWNIFSHSTKLPYFGKISEGNNSAINSYVLHGNLMLC